VKRAFLAIAVLGTAAAGVIGAAGCNVLLDASDYAVGPSDGPVTGTPDNDGSSSTSPEGATSPDGAAAGLDANADAPQVAPDGGGSIGDPCLTNGDCAAGTCGPNQWCTMACTTNSACGTNGSGNTNYCSTGGGSAGTCSPGCASDNDCQVYPSSSTQVCTPLSTGSTANVCAPAQTSGDDASEAGGGTGFVGDPCTFDTDCASNQCFQASWCTAACTSAADTSCGFSSIDAQNYCEPAPGDAGFQCYTGCTTSLDCSQLTGAVCQPMGAQSVCNLTAGAIGDPCETGPGSVYTACVAGDGGATCNDDGFCSEDCTTNHQCGKNTSGNPNYCLQSGGTGPTFCVPGCAQDGDCSPYADTFCLPVGGSATEFACGGSGGQLGDPCYSDDDCNVGECGEENACTQVCSGPGDTSCGADTQGVTNPCAYSDLDDQYECFAGCTVDTDCAPYTAGESSTCTLISGAYVCASSDATTLSATIQLRRHRARRR
jgi:hypothetical protein